MTTERTHLSIGEVLSLLQPEFPDITISKIRFLESQGLLDPERTPSGYRKFHDDDIGQLRWILTQQRDHFLPLKVIKDRLASGDLGSGTPEGVLPLGADAEGAAGAKAPVAAGSAQGSAAPSATAVDAGTESPGAPAPRPDAVPTEEPTTAEPVDAAIVVADPHPAPEGPVPPVPAEATNGNGAQAPSDAPDAPGEATPAEPTPAEADGADGGSGRGRADAVGQLVEAPEEPPADAPATDEAPAVEGAPSSDDASAAPAETTPVGRRRHPTGHQPGEPTPEPGAAPEPGAESAEPGDATALDLDDLVTGSGLSAREIAELERFGLIYAVEGSGGTSYGEDALVVARLAAGFSRYGIEPRHLRMYKVAAEREAGLFEQLISPLLKQRRASARQQAVDMLEELAELADDLRAAMVRSALREYLSEP